MSYFTKDMTIKVLSRLQAFEKQIHDTYKSFDYDSRENLGRRNMIMSQAQEKEVARALRESFKNVIQDGRPGRADIFVEDIGRELECKITSGSKSKGSVSYSLQTDWATLKKKKSIDFLFIVTNETFDRFCVMFFDSLTSDDFHFPANGSRGKARMHKENAMKKMTVLYGDVVDYNEKMINSYEKNIKRIDLKHQDKITNVLTKGLNENKIISNVHNSVDKLEKIYEKRIGEIKNKIKYWRNTSKRYSVKLKEYPE